MDTRTAFAMGRANRGQEQRVFDWVKAAKLIVEREPDVASAGLSGDWEYTGGEIWANGLPVPREDTYTYLASTWATPELDIDGEVLPCFVMAGDTSWDESTYWPPEALALVTRES